LRLEHGRARRAPEIPVALWYDRDIINNPDNYAEMMKKSGQQLSPCVEIDGQLLADVSGEEVEAYFLKSGFVKPTTAPTSVPTDRGCSDHH